MAWIPVISERNAGVALAGVYALIPRVTGTTGAAKILQVFSLKPASMRRFLRRWELAMWFDEEPRDRRELVAAMVSRLNDCDY